MGWARLKTWENKPGNSQRYPLMTPPLGDVYTYTFTRTRAPTSSAGDDDHCTCCVFVYMCVCQCLLVLVWVGRLALLPRSAGVFMEFSSCLPYKLCLKVWPCMLSKNSRMRMRGLLTLTKKAVRLTGSCGCAQECSLTLAGAPTDQNRFLLNFLKTPARRRLLHSCKSAK